ncbi:hypothetical protein JG688_00013913 [Phytophthora aleatoria]|uniref:Uncharacterized protein n=1 Tax=Phytophthora aleatoria TaxID=2496075 RepID=A0A8J5ILC2_9STRA|nr:hypothetical protein JG688_00013913 [Phytophthora aleatoria]
MAPKRKKTDEEKAFLKNRVQRSVICKLSRICKHKPIVDEIQLSVKELKQCQLEAWHLANVHVLSCLKENLPLPSLDKTFFNRCCAGVMKEAEDQDKEEEDGRDDTQRKKVKAQSKDEELIKTFRRFWEKQFDAMDHKTKKTYASRYFADQVTTNGYGSSILLTHPKDVNEFPEESGDKALINSRDPFEKARKRLPTGYSPDVMIGIDPGMRILCTAVSVGRLPRRRVRSKWLKERRKRKRKRLNRQYRRGQKIIEISTGEYRHMSKMNHFRAWNERLKKREPWYAGVVHAMPSFKTASYEQYVNGLSFFWMHLRFLMAFYTENPFLKWKFTQDRLKAKALDMLAKRIVPKPSPQVCIAYGDWSRRDGIKGHATGPVKGFVKALKKRATVLPMDEFRTSKLCSCCHKCLKQTPLFTKVRQEKDGGKKKVVKKPVKLSEKELKKKAKKEAKEKKEMERFKNPKLKDFKIVLKSNRNVLRCENSRCEANFWNRDVNAARNMLELMKGYFQNLGRMTAFVRGR